MTGPRELRLEKDERADAVNRVKNYFERERDEPLGDLAAGLLVDFIVEDLGYLFYNRGLSDAQALAARHFDSLDADLEAQQLFPSRRAAQRDVEDASQTPS